MNSRSIAVVSLLVLLVGALPAFAQVQQALEMQAAQGGPAGSGPTVASQVVTMRRNTDNPTNGNTFVAHTPTVTVTYSLSNQQYSGLTAAQGFPAGTGGNGVVLGGATPAVGQIAMGPFAIYNVLSALGSPTAAMLTSAGNSAPDTGISVTANSAVELYASVRALSVQASPPPTNARVQMADLTLTFSAPVTNPVVHFTGLGATTGGHGLLFTAEFDLVTPGLTLTRLSGNPVFSVAGASINNSSTAPGASCSTANTAACGSVRINGSNITSVTLRTFIRGNGGVPTWDAANTHNGEGMQVAVSLDPLVDLSITKTNGQTAYTPGQSMAYTVVVTNGGTTPVNGALFTDPAVTGLTIASVTCGNPTAGSQCPTAANTTVASMQGTGIAIPVLGAGGSVTFTLNATVAAGRTGDLTNTATVTAPPGVTETDPSNNTASDTDIAGVGIAGTVFQDTLGELLADGAIGSAANPALPGRTVRLYDSAGIQVGTTTTTATGAYSFPGQAAGTYYVAVDAPTVNAAGNSTSILLEQTYAAAGSGNGGSAGGASGYGPLCVEAAPGYTQQGATTTANLASVHANGYCYGGRRGAVADSGTTTLNDKEHVSRVILGGSNVTGVDFGFSPYVVTNVNNAGQGSIPQFALNAGNASTGGTYSMRVVPAVPTNASGGGGAWWQADLSFANASNNVLMQQTNRVTIFDGTPHSNTNGTAVLNPMPGDMVPSSTAVGNQGRTLGSIPRPDFMANYTGPVTTNTVLITHSTNCGGSATRNIALNIASSNASALVQESCGQYTLDQTAMGARPDGGVATGGSTGGFLSNASTPIWVGQKNVTHNYIVNPTYGITLRNGSPGVAEGYLVQGNYIVGATGAGMTLERDGATVRGNYVANAASSVAGIIDTITGTGGHLITENTVTANGRNIHLNKPNETVTHNVITNAAGAATFQGAGIVAADSNSIRISQNTFGGNTSNAIDLNRNGVTIATAGGADCPSSGVANGGVPRPRITSATLSGTTLTVSGYYCNAGTHTLEIYQAGGNASGDVGSDSLVAGEGVQYLGSLTGLSGGTFTNQTITTSALSAGGQITAISIRTDGAAGSTLGNTSEFSVNAPLSSAQLTVAKTWADATVGNAVTVSVSGTPAPVGGAVLASVANTPNETDTGDTPYGVIAGNTYTIGEVFSVGNAADYQKSLVCTGNTGTGASFDYTANATSGTITIGQDATNVVCTFTNTAVPPPPFPGCTSDMYLTQDNPTSLMRIATTNNPFTYPTLGTAALSYNASAYNPADNYIYGSARIGGQNVLLRVGSDGSTMNLGPITGAGINDGTLALNTGEIGTDGFYYVKRGENTNQAWRVDLTTRVATLITLSQAVFFSDWAWHNGLLYGHSHQTGMLYAVNPATGTTTTIGNTGITNPFGALFGASNGLFGSRNNGDFFQFNLTTGAVTLISGSPVSGNNDGAKCPTTPMTFGADLAITKDDGETTYLPGQPVVYTIVASNNGPFGAQNVTVSDPLPAGISNASWTCVAAGGGVCGAASGTGAINDTGVALPVNATVTYTLTLQVPAEHTGDLVNIATVTSGPATEDPNPGNNSATDTNTAESADLSITKTNDAVALLAGELTVYTITATNHGSAAANGAVAQDDWTTTPHLDCGTPAGGALSCAASGGAACPAPLTPEALQAGLAITPFPAGGEVVFSLTCRVLAP